MGDQRFVIVLSRDSIPMGVVGTSTKRMFGSDEAAHRVKRRIEKDYPMFDAVVLLVTPETDFR